MRNGPNNNKRMRNRNNNNNHNNNRRGQNPMTRVFESNGPDIKIRGTASHVAEKYVQLARDARTSGDPVAAENYYQHAEHYFRLIAAAQEQFRQSQPQQMPRPEGEANPAQTDDGDEGESFSNFGQEPGFAPQPQQQQPQFQQRDSQPYQQRDHQQHRDSNREQRDHRPQNQPSTQPVSDDVDRLPSFITGGAQPQPNGNGLESNEDRFNNRRRRRPHGPRPEGQPTTAPGDEFGSGSE
ncbi:MAG: DUF4167 domain-containing protein [Afipia sp.]|nr:DUF4167 domain-containing protein [Afipia sp.]